MRYARVTPSTATHSQNDIVRSCPPSKEFVIEYVSSKIFYLISINFFIRTGAQTYVLAATSNEEAHSWIKKLQASFLSTFQIVKLFLFLTGQARPVDEVKKQIKVSLSPSS